MAAIQRIDVEGHLSVQSLVDDLRRIESAMRRDPQPCAVIVNVLGMKSYDAEVRELFARWHRDHMKQIRSVAVVTTKATWRVVVATVGLLAGGTYKSFDNLADAVKWSADC